MIGSNVWKLSYNNSRFVSESPVKVQAPIMLRVWPGRRADPARPLFAGAAFGADGPRRGASICGDVPSHAAQCGPADVGTARSRRDRTEDRREAAAGIRERRAGSWRIGWGPGESGWFGSGTKVAGALCRRRARVAAKSVAIVHPMPSNALDYITTKGFKSIASIEKLYLRPINIVIGANGSGKSNFIGAFAF